MSKMKIKKYANNYKNPEIVDLPYEHLYYKTTRYKNETLDICEVVFHSLERNAHKQYDRIKLPEETYYNWYILNTDVSLVNKESMVYEHRYSLIELTNKLKKYKVSNLSFNNLIYNSDTQERVKLYANLYEVVQRVNKLTPLELETNLLQTRVITTTFDNGYHPTMSSKLYNLLINFVEVPEFNFKGRNLFKIYSEIFSLIGGSPKIIENEDGESVLDINLFDEEVGEINFDNYDEYEEVQSGENYAIEAEINTDNVVDINSHCVQGLVFGNHLQSEELLLDDQLLSFQLDAPIERIIKSYVFKIGNRANKVENTDYIKSESQYKQLDVDRGSSTKQTIQNCLTYKLSGDSLLGFGNQAKKAVPLFDSLVFQNQLEDLGFTNVSDLRQYGLLLIYVPYLNNNRIKAKTYSLNDKNKRSTVNLNNGDRINEFSKVIRDAQSKISRTGQRQVIKKIKHVYITDVYELGTYDIDTGLYIAISDVEVTANDVYATYILVEDLNIITEYVNINSENRFTDVQASLQRTVVYEDWCLLSTDLTLFGPTYTDNTSSIKSDKINLFFPSVGTQSVFKYWLLPNVEAGNSIIAPPIINAGADSILWRLPFKTANYIGNEITPILIRGETKLIERGVPYTNILGQLEKSSFIYGVDVKDIEYTQEQMQTYPYSLEFLETLQQGEERDYIFSIGTASIDRTLVETTTPNYTDTVTIPGTILGGQLNDYTFDTYNVSAVGKISTFNFTMTVSPYRSNTIDGITEIDSITIDVIATTKFGIDISYYNETFTPVTFVKTSPDFEETIAYYEEFADRDSEDNITASSLVKTININTDITAIRVELKGKFTSQEFFNDKTQNIKLEDVSYFTVTENVEDNESLLVDKNPNEILDLAYQLNYYGLSNDIVMGNALTDNSRFIFDETNQNVYTRFELYGSATKKLSKYNYNTIIGNKLSISFEYSVLNTILLLNVIEADDQALFDTLLSWSYVGVRLDENNQEKYDFICGVNKNGILKSSIIIAFKHFNPLIVNQY